MNIPEQTNRAPGAQMTTKIEGVLCYDHKGKKKRIERDLLK